MVLGINFNLSLYNTTLIFNQVLKQVRLYGIQLRLLRGCTKHSNTKILQTFRRVPRAMVNAPWYVRSRYKHLGIPTVEDRSKDSPRRKTDFVFMTTQKSLANNWLVYQNQLDNNQHYIRRLKGTKPFALL